MAGSALQERDDQDQKRACSHNKELRRLGADGPEAGVLMNKGPPCSRGEEHPNRKQERPAQVDRQQNAPENESR